MKSMKFKLLPLSIALAAAFSPMMASAVEAPQDFRFSGYARYGAHISDDSYAHNNGGWSDTSSLIKIDQSLLGNSAGRLGNEGNGAEIQFTKGFLGPNDTVWHVGFMVDHWGDHVHVKKMFASATNVLKSNPGATFWAGRDFHQRPQTQLADNFYMTHDGQGGGVKDIDLGFAKFNLGVVGQIANGSIGSETLYGSSPADSGSYAVTSKLHGIALGDMATVSILANYGFGTDTPSTKSEENSWQVATIFDTNWSKGSNQLAIRYADNTTNSVFDRNEGVTDLYANFEGTVYATQNLAVAYALAYADHAEDLNPANDRSEYSAIVRPMFNWNDIHSTWFEFGTVSADWDTGGKNTTWKATVSQNISINAFGFGRPMLRLYANVGGSDNKATQPTVEEVDIFAAGVMFEAWW